MIKTIVFDLGGVIMTIDQNEALRRFAGLGLADINKWLDPYTQTGIFGDVEEGKITAEEFRKALSELVGRELTAKECQYAWLGYRKEVPARNLELLKALRDKGYRLVLLSNTNPFMMDWALSGDFDGQGGSLNDYFDSLYLSFRLKVMKPSAQFFQYVIDGEQLNPAEAVFVDDGPRNIAAAQQLGFHTLCPANGADWRDDLWQLLDRLNGKD